LNRVRKEKWGLKRRDRKRVGLKKVGFEESGLDEGGVEVGWVKKSRRWEESGVARCLVRRSEVG
jgi:hypothetical protein